MSELDDIAGLVLAGGASSRFGGFPKAFALLAGKPLIAHALRPLVTLERRAINANRSEAEFAAFGTTIVPDLIPDAGPLGGIHAGLVWAAGLNGVRWLATVPVDTPFLPDDFVKRLAASRDAEAVIAATRIDRSPVCALWDLQQLPDIDFALKRGVRKMTDYLKLITWRTVVFPSGSEDPLFNVNSAENLSDAERRLRGA